MKRFATRITIEFVVIATAVIAAIQFVKNGHSAFGLSVLSIYAMFNLYRIGVEKINTQHKRSLKEAQIRQLEDDLFIKEAQMRRLEAALVDASIESLWVSDVNIRDNKAVYKIDVPRRGHFVIYLPVDDATKTEDAPRSVRKG